MLLLYSEQIPDASPDDLDGTCYQRQQVLIPKAGDDGRRKGHGPGRPHDEVENDHDVVVPRRSKG